MTEIKDKHEVFMGCGISDEQYQRNIEHYKEIKDKIEITGSSTGYTTHTYTGNILDESLTLDEIALICDKGCLCFGYRGQKLSNNKFSVTIYTD